jgi:hypothetical protein
VNHKSRKIAAAPAINQCRTLSSTKKLSSFEQAKANARAAQFTASSTAANKVDIVMTDEEYRRYVVTCEESHDIMMQTFSLYTQYPDAFYAI